MLIAHTFGAHIGLFQLGRWLWTNGLRLPAGLPLREMLAHSCGGAAPSWYWP